MSALTSKAARELLSSSPTVSMDDAARLLGWSRRKTWQSINEATFPVPVVRHGRTIRIPSAPLARLLGVEP